jgi:hypothetical protein
MSLSRLEDIELLEMRRFYEEELEKTLKKLKHIQSVLDKIEAGTLGVRVSPDQELIAAPEEPKKIQEIVAISENEIDDSEEEYEDDSSEEDEVSGDGQEKKTRRKRRKKTGPKPFWEDAIIDQLKAVGKPLTYEELTDHILLSHELPEERRIATKQAITNVVFRLRQRGVKVGTFSAGKKEKFVALKRWFDADGEVKDMYLEMVAEEDQKKKVVRLRKKKAGKAGA